MDRPDEPIVGAGGWREMWPAYFVLCVITTAVCAAAYSVKDRVRPPVLVPSVEEAQKNSLPDGELVELAPEAPPKVFIEVNIPATELTLFENGAPLFRRKIAIGSGVYPTPEQTTEIKRIEWNPWWYPPKSGWAKDEVMTPPGPGNPMGVVKMPLSEEVLFHGTNKEWSVGQPVSHGCMRMLNEDAAEMAWYLQSKFSGKKDPELRGVYSKQSRTTFRVLLDSPVPVRLVYDPVVAREGSLLLYPDYYGRMWGRGKAAIITELLNSGVDITYLDDDVINDMVVRWPGSKREVPIVNLMKGGRQKGAALAPECS